MNSGSVTIPPNTAEFQVTGLALATPPARVICTVRSADMVLRAAIIDGSLTEDGFRVALNGASASASRLDYWFAPVGVWLMQSGEPWQMQDGAMWFNNN